MPRRTRKRTLDELFALAALRYCRYINPHTGDVGTAEEVLEHLALQRQMYRRNRGRIFCFGFPIWKRGYVRQYLSSPGNDVVFAHSSAHARRRAFGPDCRALVWGERHDGELRTLLSMHGATLEKMEDGFLRSVGLGSDLAVPLSLVVDSSGIYYDPSKPSDLETILNTQEFSTQELRRAADLRHALLKTRLSKYNVGQERALEVPAERTVILVPGQVEDDASIRLGCTSIHTNEELLRRTRDQNPDAFIVYKPHPDVLSGNRKGTVPDKNAQRYADHVECLASLAACLDVATEVHTMTSLVGFEALLRGIHVAAYGTPFYAGWGLTHDLHASPRRTRQLTIDQLVAGTLIAYPRYWSPACNAFASPEQIVSFLTQSRASNTNWQRLDMPWPLRQLRKLRQAILGTLRTR